MRWVGSHEIRDCSYPTKAPHISAEFKYPLLTKYYTSPAFYRAGYCQQPHNLTFIEVSRHDPTGQYSRLQLPLVLSGHDTLGTVGDVCVNWSTESKNTWDQRWETDTYTQTQLMNMTTKNNHVVYELWMGILKLSGFNSDCFTLLTFTMLYVLIPFKF